MRHYICCLLGQVTGQLRAQHHSSKHLLDLFQDAADHVRRDYRRAKVTESCEAQDNIHMDIWRRLTCISPSLFTAITTKGSQHNPCVCSASLLSFYQSASQFTASSPICCKGGMCIKWEWKFGDTWWGKECGKAVCSSTA